MLFTLSFASSSISKSPIMQPQFSSTESECLDYSQIIRDLLPQRVNVKKKQTTNSMSTN